MLENNIFYIRNHQQILKVMNHNKKLVKRNKKFQIKILKKSFLLWLLSKILQIKTEIFQIIGINLKKYKKIF